ncbi:MAG: hypothetical protein A3D24_01195 [Candidatus Blackburnbacteria bacterium RIFCSPHIGHO2_02_FULL_39_13]|uniref:Single-stranded DNA-binding protein n=1 Tax=Candidatus Blackburnbacteria bacterium RIFCSPLOWO2_01_FULL_40_20 TaxID=1797519 RepID=A0A1G1VFH3_9BACT|nr:MAG: Single-stranded DNA-binding protein [Microgenomates group bacterium GW2011_GWA2_39_19]OGY07315.1 MAG: hypothetical protein A2694_04375 [Candidatus Blackburnbacteria bacterium RIFCSPHIGHO2_01_FULL_40_17]OGY08075.1 MAG: hypothetical protein A3D24_01195 [Candidatus Blackburnbacteria bacterium RIFCSPHIGHO2_02_FULL_39_13]OGY14164.1 MAG: hypothetical protein A3A77_04875 [Candidatus Blackburnbacteria bacterium RIFCSPLOWO2_01_FULL_40_20]OGY15460.1 MAG: hypothetical protein A3I52_02000 [Candidat
MASRSLNKVLLIGNLTRDPELRYTPQGTAVCTFGLATNRQWKTETGETKEDVEFVTVVAWNRLAEICSEFLTKGKQVYVEGRLSTREWEGQDNIKRKTTEVVANEVIFLGGAGGPKGKDLDIPEDLATAVEKPEKKPEASKEEPKKKEKQAEKGEDIPF